MVQRAVRAVVLGALSFCAGFGAVRTDALRRGPQVDETEGSSHGLPSKCLPAEREIASATAEVARLRWQTQDLERLRRALEGDPVPWPEQTDPGVRPEGFERLIRGAIDGTTTPMRLVETDCSEYPCIAYVDVLEYRDDGRVTDRYYQEIVAALDGQREADHLLVRGNSWPVTDGQGDHHRVAVTLWDGIPADDDGHRAWNRARARAYEDRFGL